MNSKLQPNEPLAPRHPLPGGQQVERDSHLLHLCRGKKVLHLSCAAWPATEMWCEDGSLLHLRLARVTRELAGFDLSQRGLDVLKRYDVQNLHRLNLLDVDQVEDCLLYTSPSPRDS